MDISAIANAASNASAAQTAGAASILMLRKALDMQKQSAAQLLQALPQPSNPAHLGNAVDIRA